MGALQMNANELANALKDMESGWFDDLTLKEAATMLRILDGQLAFRIDAVTKYQAWVKELEISKQSWGIIAKGYSKTIDEQQAEIEALKAHPVKELTDEEIKDLYMSMKALDQSNILIRFSRELLRKASEK
jgi:hypothetical protein